MLRRCRIFAFDLHRSRGRSRRKIADVLLFFEQERRDGSFHPGLTNDDRGRRLRIAAYDPCDASRAIS